MSRKRTYDTYKTFFEEVTKSNKMKNYQYSYILMFSFIEDRIDRIFRDQFRHKNGRLPHDSDMRNSLYRKLTDIDLYGLKINDNFLRLMNTLSTRRNEIVHSALFQIESVTKQDVELLTKFGRKLNQMREKQKKKLPKISIRKRLFLKFPSKLPKLV